MWIMHALRSSSVFDGERFRPEGATVICDGDTIIGVEPAAYDVPRDCEVTTYDGTLLPGLIDCHVHLVSAAARAGEPGSLEWAGGATAAELDDVIEQSLRANAAAGVTTVRDLGDTAYRTLVHRDRAAPGLPRIRAAGPPLTVPEGHCFYLGGAVDGPVAIKAAIAERVDRGVDVVKVMASGGMLTVGSDVTGVQFGADDLRLLVDLAHEAGLRVLAHAHSLAGIRHALAAGADGIEHFTGLVAAGTRSVPDDVLAQVAEQGVTVDPTLGIDLAVLQGFTPPAHVQAMLAGAGGSIQEGHAERVADAGRLHEYGVRVVSGLDAGAAPTKRHGNLWRAVSDLVAGGWPVDAAVATATSVAAEDCGLADTTGRLRPGLSADLLVLHTDLRTDPTALSRPLEVVVRGVLLG